jgi:CMP-N-acetylneuraminic acid synthetase
VSVLCLIPARTGSKGIPGKNFKPLAGVSPLERAITCCVGAGLKAWVTSDGPAVNGWPWWIQTNSPDIHQDASPMRNAVRDFLSRVDGPPDETILLIQPTQPLREPKHLHAAIALLNDHESVASVVECEPTEKLYRVINGYLCPAFQASVERRQDAIPTYRCDGTVYAFRRSTFLACPDFRTARTAALIIPPEESAPLDTHLDWINAENRIIFQGAHTRPPFCPTAL